VDHPLCSAGSTQPSEDRADACEDCAPPNLPCVRQSLHRERPPEQVKLLDGVVQYRFGDDAELMGAWHSARNVAGPLQAKSGPESAAGGGQTPKAA